MIQFESLHWSPIVILHAFTHSLAHWLPLDISVCIEIENGPCKNQTWIYSKWKVMLFVVVRLWDFCFRFLFVFFFAVGFFYLYAVFGMVQCNLDTPFNCNWNKFITIRKWKCQHRATIPANCQWKWGDKWQSATLNRRASTHTSQPKYTYSNRWILCWIKCTFSSYLLDFVIESICILADANNEL